MVSRRHNAPFVTCGIRTGKDPLADPGSPGCRKLFISGIRIGFQVKVFKVNSFTAMDTGIFYENAVPNRGGLWNVSRGICDPCAFSVAQKPVQNIG